MRIDHLLLVTRDIDASAARLLADHGLGSVEGGDHPAWGTGNALVPVGDAYVELFGIRDEAAATTSPVGGWVMAQSAGGEAALGKGLPFFIQWDDPAGGLAGGAERGRARNRLHACGAGR